MKVVSLDESVLDLDVYPMEAFEFIQHGLNFTAERMHRPANGATETSGQKRRAGTTRRKTSAANRHVSGRELCEGLRDYARQQWGLLARSVLQRWNITTTLDFGRIVFIMVDKGLLRKTTRDTIEDFRNVYDFKTAFETDYRIESEL